VVEIRHDFADFVRDRYKGLVRYGFALLADLGRAEDLVQSSLVKTLRAWPRLTQSEDHRRAAESYTKVVMTRAAWRESRKPWRRETPTAPLPEPTRSTVGDFESAIGDADIVTRALAALPTDQRVVLVLRYLEDMSEVATANLLKCPVGTVKSRSARALEAIRGLELFDDVPVTAPKEIDR
jgi:RNA polymerase sigma-70 factor (sigma-E family)